MGRIELVSQIGYEEQCFKSSVGKLSSHPYSVRTGSSSSSLGVGILLKFVPSRALLCMLAVPGSIRTICYVPLFHLSGRATLVFDDCLPTFVRSRHVLH